MHGICSIWLQLVDEREQGLHLVLHGDRTQAKRERNTAADGSYGDGLASLSKVFLSVLERDTVYGYEDHTARYGKRFSVRT